MIRALKKILALGLSMGVLGLLSCGSSAPRNDEDGVFEQLILKFKEHEKAVSHKDILLIGTLNEEIHRLSEKHVDKLLVMAGGENIEWRVVATAALGFVKNETYEEALLAVLTRALDDGNADVRHNAAGSLGHLALSQTPYDKLIQLLADPSPLVRRAASYALSLTLPQGENEAYVPDLILALSDSDSGVRQHVTLALGRIGSTKGVEALVKKALQQPDKELRKNATISLSRIKYTPFVENAHEQLMDLMLSMDESVASEAWGSLQVLNTANVPLIQLLKDPDTEVVKSAADSLKAINGHDFGRMYSKWKVWQEDSMARELEARDMGIRRRKDEAARKLKEQGGLPPEQKPADAPK